MIGTTRRSLLLTAAAGMAMPAIARAAETATEISFYFPVAVGGPITRIIDGYAADFQRENAAMKVTPIYAGTYQDTLTKTQTALKANAGPQMAVLLSTDVFSLIDDDLIVPFDAPAQSGTDTAWLRSLAHSGRTVMLGDPGRTYLPADGLSERTRYVVPTSRDLEDREIRDGVVWQVLPPESCSRATPGAP